MWRKVISSFHIFFKSLSVLQLHFESGEDEEQVYGGISVAESCGIQGTWPDS